MKKKDSYINALEKGKDLEILLPKYGTALADAYFKASMLDFVMDYVTFYESFLEQTTDRSLSDGGEEESMSGYVRQMNEVLKQNLLEPFDGTKREEAVKLLFRLRKEVKGRIENLTVCSDIHSKIEYILNRMEYQFSPDEPEEDIDELLELIFGYLFESEDMMDVNARIKEVLEKLPVRMTRQKFFGLLEDSYSVYIGHEADTLEFFDYLLRSEAMLYKPEADGKYYKKLTGQLKEFVLQDFASMSQADYEAAVKQSEEIKAYLENQSDQYISLAGLMNSLYTMILAKPYTTCEPETAAVGLMKIVEAAFSDGQGKELPKESEEYLYELEGLVEPQYDYMVEMEAGLPFVLEQYKKFTESLMLGPLYESLSVCRDLMSGSLFPDLNAELPVSEADTAMVEEYTGRLLEELKEAFSSWKKPLRRAVMAGVFGKLPVFFNSKEEMYDYFKNALENCGDRAEVAFSFRSLHWLML